MPKHDPTGDPTPSFEHATPLQPRPGGYDPRPDLAQFPKPRDYELAIQQKQRIDALRAAKEILGPDADVVDLHTVAEYILKGGDPWSGAKALPKALPEPTYEQMSDPTRIQPHLKDNET